MTTLKVQKRDMEIKPKRLRREGFVTGNLFGKEIEGSIPIQIEQKEADRIRRECTKGSRLILELDGKKYDTLFKEFAFDAMKNQILEMDFQAMVKGEKVHSVAEIVLLNRDSVASGVVEQLLDEISYKALPENLIEKVEIDCSNLKAGDTINVSDLPIAKDGNIDLITHADTSVVSVAYPHNKDAEEEETAAEAEAPAAE